MKRLSILLLVLVGCKAKTPEYTNCAGFANSNTYAPPSALTQTPPPLPTNHDGDFFAADGFNLGLCTGVRMFYPGVGYQSGKYYPGQTLVLYVYSVSFSMLYLSERNNAVTTDVRVGLYDVEHFSPEPGQGTINSGNNGSIPTMVATFTYAPPYGGSPAIILNQVATSSLNSPTFANFGTNPLVLTVTIPSDWTSVYQIGATLQFNHAGTGDAIYQYTLHGSVQVQ